MALGLHSHFKRRPLLCDSGPTPINAAFSSHSQDVKAPKSKNKILSPRAVRQISAGSVIGLLSGMAISVFSKPLAVLFGILVFSVQFAATKGYDILPVDRIQRYMKGIDVKSALQKNVPFKLSLGTTLILAAFAEF